MCDESANQFRPAGLPLSFGVRQEREPRQGVMQLVCVRRVRPRLGAHALDSFRIQLADISGALCVQPAATHYGLRAALFERRIVEVSVRTRREDFERKRGRLGQVTSDDLDLAGFEATQQPLKAFDIHRLLEAVADRLTDQRMVGDLELTGQVLGAGELVRKDRREQIFRRHARQRGRHFLPAPEARQGQGDGRAPAPTRGKHRRRT